MARIKHYLPYAIAAVVLFIAMSVGFRIALNVVAPDVADASTTIAWIITSVAVIGWYATRDEESPGDSADSA